MSPVTPRHISSAADLITNPVFLSAFFSWVFTQFIKVVYGIVRRRIKTFKEALSTLLWKTGGMPSSHSALIAGVTTAIAFDDGISSDIFILSLCFALVVVRDALGVRRSAGAQARALNDLGRELQEKASITYRPVKVVLGHTPVEVAVGIVLGILIALACSLLM